jgi:hypothetical protein
MSRIEQGLTINELGNLLIAEFRKLKPEQREDSLTKLITKLRTGVGELDKRENE